MALPLTPYLTVLLKGVGFALLWQDAAILCAMATVILALSVARFSKTIE